MPRGNRDIKPLTLHECLESYTVPPLKKLAGLLDPQPPTHKAELIDLIHRALSSPDRLRRLWDALDKVQRAALSEAVYSRNGRLDVGGFRAKYGRDPDWGEVSRYGELEKPSLLQLFFYRGVVPPDLKERLVYIVPRPRTIQVSTIDAPPSVVTLCGTYYDGSKVKVAEGVPVSVSETERVAQHDLLAVLRLIDAGKIRASDKTQRVTAAGAREITAVLQGGDFYPPETPSGQWDDKVGPIKAFVWPLIVQAADLARLAGTRLELTAAGRKALAAPTHETIRQAWERWQKTTLLDEMSRVEAIKGQGGRGKRAMTPVPARRAEVVAALRQCPPREWVAFDEFSRFTRAAGHTFEISNDLWTLYIADPEYGSLGYSGSGGWEILQERYMLALLFEVAATLGVIDVAYITPDGARLNFHNQWGADDLASLSRYDGLLALRVNGLGAWCLGTARTYVPAPFEARPVLKILPTFEVVATEVLPPADALFLEQIAAPQSEFVWRIERSKLLEAAEQGHAVADAVSFLQAKSATPVPENVAIFFEETAKRAASLAERGPALLIEVEDTVLAHLIANDTRTRSLCLLAGERYLVVLPGAENTFRRALHDLGYGLAGRAGSMGGGHA